MDQNIKKPRPPIVAILGHVDHGKTTLLDSIRKTNIAAREAGGITQSIGAWQIGAKNGKKITFIDTPGHEAFREMRSRGARVSDIAVLVVAADDGVMPQTKESIQYIKEAKTPFLVAITKIDLPTAQPEKVKNQLLQEEVLLEGYGGDVPAVEVSGKTGKGIEDLVEIILLLAEVNGVEEDIQGDLEAPVIEAKLDRRRGVVVHAVLRNGKIKVGDEVEAEGIIARVRGLFDETQKPLKEALPGMPVEILGFSKIPPVGSILQIKGREVRTKVEEEKREIFFKEGLLPLVLKADTAGSLEAISRGLGEKVFIYFSGIGDIADSDVLTASSTLSTVVGFNTRVSKEVQKLAEEKDVRLHVYKIIYELFQDVDKWIKEKEEKGKEKILGRAQIIKEFPYGKEKIAGCRILEGVISRDARLRLIREGQIVVQMRSMSLRLGKEKVDKVSEVKEFGILFSPTIDFKIGDVIESWQS